MAEIFNDYGYPTSENGQCRILKNIGCLLLEHSGDMASYDKYFSLVEEAYFKGEVDKHYFIMLIDRINFRKNGYQIFGTHRGIPFC